MDAGTLAAVAGAAAAVVGTTLAVGAALSRPIRRIGRQNDEFREDWYGTPARPGVPRRPGVPERLANIEGRLDDHARLHGIDPSGPSSNGRTDQHTRQD